MTDNPNAGGPSHSAKSSISQVDSIASTLIASPHSLRFQSFDKHRKYSDLERDLYAKANDIRERHGGKDDFDDDEFGSSDQENERLLADAVATLTSRTAGTINSSDEEPNILPVKEKARQIAWSELPKKGQLAILTLARLSEPLTQQGLQSYMFYQLKSFKLANGESPSDSTVASQAGILAAAFTGAQFLTAMMWGRLADSETFGRKKVILIGLLGTTIGSLGFGFSKSFATAVFWRCLGGMLNGNIGVMRTMISEISSGMTSYRTGGSRFPDCVVMSMTASS